MFNPILFTNSPPSFRRQEEKSGERKLLLEDVVGAAPGVRDMGAVGWGAAGAGIHDRDGTGGKFRAKMIHPAY